MNKKFTTSQITLLGLMIAILLLMAYTPLGYLNIGPLAITFNIIPVAVSAITMGPVGGAIAGAVFGLTSFGQCIGIGGTSLMGVTLFGINPFLAFVQRFIPRLVDGLLLGYIFRGVRRKSKNIYLSCADVYKRQLYEVHMTVEDGGDFDLSETEKEIKISAVLGI